MQPTQNKIKYTRQEEKRKTKQERKGRPPKRPLIKIKYQTF